MPFNLRNFEEEAKAKMGVHECVTHKLVEPFQVLYEKHSEYYFPNLKLSKKDSYLQGELRASHHPGICGQTPCDSKFRLCALPGGVGSLPGVFGFPEADCRLDLAYKRRRSISLPPLCAGSESDIIPTQFIVRNMRSSSCTLVL